jgi:ectoine hydroxylase-related dioxygenase (phytanoyl-CoA dioxygenase family)
MSLPDIDNSTLPIRSWAGEPGDVIALNFRTVNGTNANSLKSNSRTLSFRLLGDDTRYIKRPGKTSPDYPSINQQKGERLREDWFPIIYN